ncbi:iron-containing alcohol dehydrogenase family protein [Brevibacillus daliensis]|uniref:iron-containing alcohol dehydrogenase family protein n=1 Tax=Brevibacillus daliensis TaxID=2892995 RepID=UPI001E645D6B|nr:iron-containing alcohol dehydrogenase family protein [Brevibacillus daliensis]
MSQQIIVRGAPALYRCESGILQKLDALLAPYAIKRVLVVHGQRSLQAAEGFFAKETTLTLIHFLYRGECTLEEASRIAKTAQEEQADVILGVGGGKVLDLVKAAGNEANLETILVPTLASNCAAWTPLSVFYDEHGTFTHYHVFPKSTLMVLVEPELLLQAPVEYLRAGIADTLAKWYEGDALIRKVVNPSLAIQIAHHSAKLCESVLLKYGEESILDARNGQLTDAFIQVAETIFMAGGMVGGFGDQLGRIAGAHSVHNGLTVAEATHSLLHGDKVAYGILVQLVLEKNVQEVKRLLPYYQKMELPYCLQDLGLSGEDRETLQKIAMATTHPNESIHLMGGGFTAENVYEAMLELENVDREKAVSATLN